MRQQLSQFRAIADPNLLEVSDRFLSSGVSSGSIGNVGWTETNSAAGTNLRVAGALNKPGVFRQVTGAVSGNNKRLHLGLNASDGTIAPGTFDRFSFLVAIPTITTVLVRLGLAQDLSAAGGGTAGAYFEFDPTLSANWRTVTRQASVSTANASAIAVTAGNWYLLDARREDSGNWVFSINTAAAFTHSTNQPSTACSFGTLLQTVTAAARNLDLGYAYCRAGLGQLYT